VTTTGVAVMAYGTPSGPDEVEAYYTDIRRGRAPSQEQLADLVRRYEAIGGTSPLRARTEAQMASIAAHLDRRAPGRFDVLLGTKHSRPTLESAVHSLAERGAASIVGLVLAPHFSQLSIGEYESRVAAAAAEHGLSSATIHSWHDLPELIEALSARVRAGVEAVGASVEAAELMVLFTAHSLPARILAGGDPYPAELEGTARLVAEAAGIERWRTAWQSAGRTPEPWLGPDICELLPTLRSEGVEKVVICPAGFTSDHLEVLYDLDIEARWVAAESGLELARTASINDDDGVCAGLARLVAEEAARLVLAAE
jgi:ferrochelatase